MSLLTGNRLQGSYSPSWQNSGPPTSGTSGTLAGYAQAGDWLRDVTNGVLYIDEGTQTSPYWTPVGFGQAPLFGVWTDFRDTVGKAVTDTGTALFIPGSGVRIYGQGLAEIDSGIVSQTAGEGGASARITTTDEAAHLVAVGMAAGVMQPDQHGLLVVEAELTHVTALTNRTMFLGFLGTAADALDPAVTGSATTATLVQDDLAGVWFDTGNTDADRLYGVHNKSDEAATQDLAADGDTSTDIAAVGTYQRLRVEINADGDMVVFADKVQIYAEADALDADEEVSPVLYLGSNTTATQSLDIRRFAAWACR